MEEQMFVVDYESGALSGVRRNGLTLSDQSAAQILNAQLEALKEAEKYLVERGIEQRGTVGRTVVLPKIRAAIALAEGKK